jgi:hypothetical protein
MILIPERVIHVERPVDMTDLLLSEPRYLDDRLKSWTREEHGTVFFRVASLVYSHHQCQ